MITASTYGRLLVMRLAVVVYIFLIIIPSVSKGEIEEIRFAVSDIQGLEELHREFSGFANKLSELTGYSIKLFPLSSRTAAVEALKREKLDIVLTGPAEYVVMKKKAGALPLVALLRPEYYSAIITLKKNGIHRIRELRGSKIGLGYFGSTSYHLAPLKLLLDHGLKRDEIDVLHLNKNVSWAGLKKGSLAAIGMNYQRFLYYVSKDRDLSIYDFRVLARSGDLPNDLIVVGRHVPTSVRDRLSDVFDRYSDQLISSIKVGNYNQQKYATLRFSKEISDRDYDMIRELYKRIGYPEFE